MCRLLLGIFWIFAGFLLLNDGWMNQFLNYLDQIALLHANKLDHSSQKPPIHNISSIGTTYKYLLKTGTMASKVLKNGCCHTPIVMFEPGQKLEVLAKKGQNFV